MEGANTSRSLHIVIIGGGLVGSVCACLMAKRGHIVDLYEYRGDIRQMELAKGRSINLSMSDRARVTLKEVGLEDHMVNNHGIPMKARMIHDLDGSLTSIPYDARNNQCIYSVGRKYLNEVLLSAAEKCPNVRLFFNHKLINAVPEEGKVTLLHTETKNTIDVTADLIIGADGAFSALRRILMKQELFNFSQTYIEHGYLELCIPAINDEFAMLPNYLHIWPRGEFMMIALPNQDKSWTVTLFMPFSKFQSLKSGDALLHFFREYFPDAVPLLGEKRLVDDFFKSSPCPLVSIKCSPYHVRDRAIIIGDAAHAMVPFYGQGMNAGFEDCLILDQLLHQHNSDLATALSEFTALRNKDAYAICDLAMYNYVEMRDLVTRKSFRLRKKLDNFLHWLLPSMWVPLYNSVTFSNMGYSQCAQNKRWQDEVISRFLWFVAFVVVISLAIYLYSYNNDPTIWYTLQKFLHKI